MLFCLIPLLVLLFFFFVLPLGLMFYESLFLSPLQVTEGSGMTLANYVKLFGDFFYVKVLFQTLALGAVVTVLALLMAYPLAYLLARTPRRRLLIFLVISPLVVSIVIRSYGWMVLLGRAGTVNTMLQAIGATDHPLALMYNWFGVTIALTHVLLPYMILTLTSVIEGIPESLENSAAVLGAGWWARFRHVLLPLSIEGVGTGVTLVFMLVIGSFVSVLLLGGSDTLILPLLIYQQVNVINNNFAAALGAYLLVISIILLYFQTRAFRLRSTA
jgi:putative spermidine/putrescine transport system permease protein